VANKAHVYKAKSGNYNISFHHPICREGTIGKKIHRGLKVSDEAEARRLGQQLDDLLLLADTPAQLPTRSQAVAEQKYEPVIIDAFFDCITPDPIDYVSLRERAMPLPEKGGKKGPTPRVLFAGPTGNGKSRIVQHLLQTTFYNFPMRGAGRTTVADSETIVGDYDYAAVVTFYSENEMREIIKENILEACAFSRRNREAKCKIASKLLIDSDKRFRFNFTLGELKETEEPEENFEADDEEEASDIDAAVAPSLAWAKLEACVAEIISMSDQAFAEARRELCPTSEQDEAVVEEYWLQYIDRDQLDALAEQMLEELERRLRAATGQPTWPLVHRVAETPDLAEFFRRLRPFYQNSRKLFGSLVTPLVQGIRVRGRFPPPPYAEIRSPSWVLIDGQGLEHEQGGPSDVTRTIPPELAQKFSSADVICLVDRAVPAMTGDAPLLLENLILRGYQNRVALVFTRFEDVSAPDLDFAGKKAKVLEGLSNAIQSIALPKAQRVLLEQNASEKTYLLSRLNLPDIKHPLTRSEIKRLCKLFRRGGEETLPKYRPRYNEFKVANALRREIEAYRREWSAERLAQSHWKIMEALTNWIGNAYNDGYPRRNLYPGQSLSQRLFSAVSNELEAPSGWDPYQPDSAEEESRILNAIRSKLADKVDEHCRVTLVRDPRTAFWLPAYEDIYGPGTKVKRARAIARILEDRAQLPDEGLGEFTKNIWRLVEETIAEVCSLEPEKGLRAAS
jgi:hypothetical protein